MNINFFLLNSLHTARVTLAEDTVTLVVNNVLLARDANLCTGLVFVDLSKAFDRVQHQQLVNILAGVGVEGTALDLFVSSLNDRRQEVKSGISLGVVKACSRGVPKAVSWGLCSSHCTHTTSLHY